LTQNSLFPPAGVASKCLPGQNGDVRLTKPKPFLVAPAAKTVYLFIEPSTLGQKEGNGLTGRKELLS